MHHIVSKYIDGEFIPKRVCDRCGGLWPVDTEFVGERGREVCPDCQKLSADLDEFITSGDPIAFAMSIRATVDGRIEREES